MKLCTVDGCGRKHNAKGYCPAHYRQWVKGKPFTPVLLPSVVRGDEKQCTVCEDWFPLAHYEGNRRMCRMCRSVHRRAARFGLPFDELLAMVAEGACNVCHLSLSYTDCHVDHCHSTGRVRGVLCAKCNLALGYMDDDPARIDALAAYLRRTSAR